MKDERNHHTDNEKDMKKDKKTLKEEYGREESSNIGDVEEKEKELEQNLKDLNKELELKKKGLIQTYERKLEDLRAELELRLKVEIHEIEERKN